MKAARVSQITRHWGKTGEVVEVQHEAVDSPIRKTMKPADHATNRELRKRRDLLWLLLSKQGMTSTEIANTCLHASRSPRQIRKRLDKLRQHQAKRVSSDG